MELVKGKPFFCTNVEKIRQYPYVNSDLECEILIVGGGIDGAIANYYLSKKYDVVLVEGERMGIKGTACATALLEYQLDDFAQDLSGKMSGNTVLAVYKAGLFAIDKIEAFLSKYGNKCGFNKKDTLVFSTSVLDKQKFLSEYEFRKRGGLDVELIEEGDARFPFEVKYGLYCKDGGAEFNPYLFEKQMLENSTNCDRIFENTVISGYTRLGNDFIVKTNYGNTIKCKKIVCATGFDFTIFHDYELCEKDVTYTVVFEPMDKLSWRGNALVQDFLQPYHYIRLLDDNRLMVGGEDTVYHSKISERVAEKKYKRLIKLAGKMFPKLEGAKVESKFCGLFASTENNMGLIGESREDNIFYFYSCGANGIINAMFGIDTLISAIERKSSQFSGVFSPKRK